MLAYKVMQIAIKTRLGSCALTIKGQLRNDKVNEAAKLAATHIVFHKAGGKAREDGADVAAVVKTALGDLFENIEIETSHWEKPDRIVAMAKALGVPQAELAEFVASCKAAENEAVSAPVEESDDEVVG